MPQDTQGLITHGLILREGGFATGPVPPVPERMGDWLVQGSAPLPDLAPGQVRIEVALSPVNPSDLYFVQGGYGQPRRAGLPAGFEGCGTVVACGAGAEHLATQRVAFVATQSGSWAHHAVTDAAVCIPLRDDLADRDGAALIVNPLTAVALVDRVQNSGARSFVLNAAGSQLGRLILALARDRGLAAIAIVRRGHDAEALRALGATEVLITSDPDHAAALAGAIKTHKPRIFLDAVADQHAADLFHALPAGSVWVVYGKMSLDAPRLGQMGQLIFMDKRIEGFWLTRWLPATPPDRRAALAAEVQARFVTGTWTTRVAAEVGLDIDALDRALRLSLADNGGKVMIRPGLDA